MTGRSKSIHAALAVSVAIVAMAASMPAMAQVTPDPTGNGVDSAAQAASEAQQARGVVLPGGSSDDSTGVEDPNDVVVTGTRIFRPNSKSAAPITTVTAAEIAKQGALNVEDVLNRLPQITPDSQQNYQDSDGRQRVSLRNLGFDRTLALVDGMRMGIGGGEGLDVSILPTQLIDRIDVLSGGASSVYGSDAISGVVNFILKKNYDGVSLNANYGLYNHVNGHSIVGATAAPYAFPIASGTSNDGGRADVSLTAGKNLFDDKLNLSGFVDYRHSDLVPYSARETSACQLNQPVKDGPLSCQQSSYSTSGFIQPQSGANAGRSFVNNPDGSRTFVPYGIGSGNAANPYDDYSYQRADERINAGGFLTLKLSPAAEIFATGLYYHDRSTNPSPSRVFSYTVFGSTPYKVNCNNPFLSASQAQALCGAAAGTSTLVPLDVRYRFGTAPTVDTYVNSGVRLTAGIRGTVASAWHYELSGEFSRNRNKQILGSDADPDKVNRSLNVVTVNGKPTCDSVVKGTDPSCVPFDAFSAGNANQSLVDYLQSPQGTQFGITRGIQLLGTVTGDLGKYGISSPLAEQGIAIAFGVEHRNDKLEGGADATYRRLNGGTDQSFRQEVVEGNVEVQIPLVEKKSWTDLLQVNGGYRVSKYSGINDKFGTYKVEGLWAPIPDVTFRASYNKAQRAPDVIEFSQANTVGYVRGPLNDPCASTPDPNNAGKFLPPVASLAACKATGLPDNLYGSTTLSCPDQQCTLRSGGFNIKPETAYTKTFGVVLRPRFLRGLTLSVDRYLIDLNDSIGFNYPDFYTNGCIQTADPFYCKGIVRNPGTYTLSSAPSGNPSTGFVEYGTTNFYKATSHGWDVQGQWGIELDKRGRLDFLFNGSRPTYTGGQDAPNLPAHNSAGYYGPYANTGFPLWQHSLRSTYTTADGVLNLSLNWRYIGPMTISYNAMGNGGLPYGAADVRSTYNHIDAYNYFDLSATVSIAKRLAIRGIVNNLFDKDPPIIPNSYNISLSRNNTIGGRYDILGRQILMGVTLTF